MYDFVVQKRIVLEIHQKLIFVSKMVCLKHPIFSIYGASHAAKRYVTLVRQGERVRGNISETGMQIVEGRVRDSQRNIFIPSCVALRVRNRYTLRSEEKSLLKGLDDDTRFRIVIPIALVVSIASNRTTRMKNDEG